MFEDHEARKVFYQYKGKRVNINREPHRPIIKQDIKYTYKPDYEYIYSVLVENKRDGPLFDNVLGVLYLEYLTRCLCICNNSSIPLLTLIFNDMEIIPISDEWKRFEQIIKNIPGAGKIWNEYNYLESNPPLAKGIEGMNANYFIYNRNIPVTELTKEDIESLPLIIYARPLPARRPKYPEPSTEKLDSSTYLYRKTYIYKKYMQRAAHHVQSSYSHDENICMDIMNGVITEVNNEIENAVIRLMLCDVVVTKDYTTENKLYCLLARNSIQPHDDRFIRLENFIYSSKREGFINEWLKWNYFECGYPSILDDEDEYFGRLTN